MINICSQNPRIKKAPVKGWQYGYSEALEMKFAVKSDNGKTSVYTEDKVHYDGKEIDIIAKKHGEISPQAHMIKKMFEGEIIS